MEEEHKARIGRKIFQISAHEEFYDGKNILFDFLGQKNITINSQK